MAEHGGSTSANEWAIRLDVTALVLDYLSSIDDRRFGDAGDCFALDGTLEFGDKVFRSPATISAQIESDLTKYAATQHMINNSVVTLTGKSAHLRAEAIGTHTWVSDDGSPMQSVVGGRYAADLRQEDTGWRIVRLAPEYLWVIGEQLVH